MFRADKIVTYDGNPLLKSSNPLWVAATLPLFSAAKLPIESVEQRDAS